jgi:sulfur transfer complex TusBCD TusB component (DsrH family)
MNCRELTRGYNAGCDNEPLSLIQKVVLINYDEFVDIEINESEVLHNILFKIENNDIQSKGYAVENNIVGSNIDFSFTYSINEGIELYAHKVSFLVRGLNQDVLAFLRIIDKGRFVVAIRLTNGKVFILGSGYGMRTTTYSYSTYSIISMESDVLEYTPPYYYAGDPDDFVDNWENPTFDLKGDYNNDFNNDFRINFIP